MWEHIPRLVVKGREIIYKQDLLLSGTALLKVVKSESDVEGLITRNKTAVGIVQMAKGQIRFYILSEESSSSDSNLSRQVSIQVSDLEGESEAVSLRISVSS